MRHIVVELNRILYNNLVSETNYYENKSNPLGAFLFNFLLYKWQIDSKW